MKILAVTDIHGAYEMVAKMLAREAPDVLVVGGDLTTIGTLKEAEDAIRRFRDACPRICAVAGNMDLPQHDELFVRLGISLNGRAVRTDRARFFGVSAAPLSQLHTPYEIPEEEISERILSGWAAGGDEAAGPAITGVIPGEGEEPPPLITVFVSHAPPYGTKLDIARAGIHVGSTAVRDFIEEYAPDVVICGHIHEARGLDSIGPSRIVNCGPAFKGCYALLDLAAGKEISIVPRQLPIV